MRVVIGGVLILALVWWWISDNQPSPDLGKASEQRETTIFPKVFEAVDIRVIEGNPFLEDYGREGGTVVKDLEVLRAVVQDCQLLFKDFDRFHLPDNAAIVRFLSGGNPDKLAWISGEHPCLSGDGELMDRMGKPVFFHRLSGMQFELRSAGKDGEYWTSDDVVVK